MTATSPKQQRRFRAWHILALFWVAFLLRGLWYCALLPPWEGYDEPFHFAALQRVAAGQGMPQSQDRISLEVQQSLHLLPLPWMLQFHAIPHPLQPYDDYWKLTPAEREQRRAALAGLDPADGQRAATEPIVNYEAQQPPLYYRLLAVPLRLAGSWPLLDRLFLMRLLSLLLASAVVPLAYWVAVHALDSRSQALAVAGLIVLLPELFINLCRAGNEGPAMVAYTVMLGAALAALAQPASWCLWLVMGAALGLGMLSKAHLLVTLPALLVLSLVAIWSRPPGRTLAQQVGQVLPRLFAALALAAAIAGPYFRRVHAATGSWTGALDEAAASHMTLLQKLAQVPHVDWKSGFVSIALSHVWFGGWSFLRLPNAVYLLAFVAVAAAFAGAVYRLLKRSAPPAQRRNMLVVAAFYLSFWAGLLYHVLLVFMRQGVSASTGWYLYAAIAAEMVLLVWGLQAWLSPRIGLTAFALALGALDLYTVHALLMPYYTGLTMHDGRSVPAALGATVTQPSLVFARLSQLQAAWLHPPVLRLLWLAYVLATLATVAAVAWLVKSDAGDAQPNR